MSNLVLLPTAGRASACPAQLTSRSSSGRLSVPGVPRSAVGRLLDGSRPSRSASKQQRNRNSVVVRAEEAKPKISFGDRLLDYIEGGPKLRRWYGAAELMPRDGSLPDEDDVPGGGGGGVQQEEEKEEGPADAVLVSDGDSESGQMVILSLILKRRRIRALVKDSLMASESYGPYVEVVTGNVSDAAAVRKALKGAGAVIVTGKAGVIPEALKGRRVQHIILLSQVGVSKPPSNPFASIIGAASRDQANRDESVVKTSGVPYTIIRTGQLKDEPSGTGVLFGQGDELRGSLAREDAAAVCVAALEAGAPADKARVFEVVNSPSGASDDAQFVDQISRISPMAVAAE